MINKHSIVTPLSIMLTSAIFISTVSLIANAQSATGTPAVSKATQARITKIQTRADQEITRRIDGMNLLITRLGQMAKLSDSDKTTLTSELQSNITNLKTLQSTIDSETVIATLQTDVKSIASTYRIFALVMPRDNVIAAADKLASTVDALNILSTKISSRLTDPNFTISNMTSVTDTLGEIKAKLQDASTQAQNAINAVVPLVPDNSDKSVMASNTSALKTARGYIKTGTADIKTVLAEIKALRKSIDKLKPVTAQNSATSTASTTSQ